MQSSLAEPSLMRHRAIRYTKGTALLGLSLLFAAVAGCGAPPPTALHSSEHPALPAKGAVRYRMDDERSEVLIWVRSEGPLAYLGHNHILQVGALTGELWLAPDPQRSVFRLAFPVAALRLDEPARRAQQGAGYEETLSAEDIAGTRAHLLDAALLDGNEFPQIELYSESISGSGTDWIAHTIIQVRTFSGHVDIPVQLESTPDQVTVSGEFTVTHAMLGLVPHSALLGSLRVAEPLRIRFRLVAMR
jgi:hypothetical protein